jgi:transposase
LATNRIGTWLGCRRLAYIISQGDHRKVNVQAWVEAHQQTLQRVCGIRFTRNDWNDDRLAIVLRRLSQVEIWEAIERDMSCNSIAVYQLETKTVRVDATTVSGHHLVSEEGVFQFGHSKDDARLPQVKVMMGVLAPLGMPLLTQVVSGEKADDPLYRPVVRQISQQLQTSGLLYVGDSKMSALATRGQVAQQQDFYLCPLPMTGNTPLELAEWVEMALSGQVGVYWVERPDAANAPEVIAEGYEIERQQEVKLDGQRVQWQERVRVVYNPILAQQQSRGLEQRLETAQAKLLALTPPPGRGQRMVRDATQLQGQINAVLQQQQVEGMLQVKVSQQTDAKQQSRFFVEQLERVEAVIEAAHHRYGWRPYVTNAPSYRLSLPQAVLVYRDEWQVEDGFRHLKGVPLSLTPLFVQREDQVVGLLPLLSLALRLRRW